MSNKWKPFFINKDFLQLYLNKIGVSDYVDIDRIVDLNDISLKRKHKFLFGIAKIKKNFDLKDKISQYNLTNEKSVYISYPNDENKQHYTVNFMSLIISGFCNAEYNNSINEGSIIEKVIKNIKEEKRDDTINDYYDKLNNVIINNESLNKLHNDIIEDVFEDKYDTFLNWDNPKNKIKTESSTETSSFTYSLFFLKNSILYEYFPYYHLLLEVKTDNDLLTQGNITEVIESHVLSNQSQYDNDFFIFSEINELPKETALSFSLFNFFMLILSAILLIVNFIIVNPEKSYYQLNSLYNTMFFTNIINSVSEGTEITNSIDEMKETFTTILMESIYNNDDTEYNFMNSDDSNNIDEKYINITNRKIYFYDVNYFCGLQIEYEIGIKEKESDKRYDVDISYEKITPRTNSSSKGKIYFPPNLSKTVYPMFIDEYKDIFTDKLYSMKSTILFYNHNYEIASVFEIKYTKGPEGNIERNNKYIGFKPFINYKHSTGMIVLNVIYMLVLLYMGVSVIRVIIEKTQMFLEHKVIYFEGEDALDVIVTVISIVNFVMLCVYMLFRKTQFPISLYNQDDFTYWIDTIKSIEAYQVLSGITILLTCIRIVIYLCKFFPTFHMLISPLVKGVYEFIAVLIVTLIMLVFFAFLGWGIFGGSYDTYNTSSKSFINTFSIVSGIFDSNLISSEKKNGTIITITVVILVVIIYFIFSKIFFGVYSFRYDKEMNKKLIGNQAINKIYIDNTIAFLEKVYCLITCTSYNKYVNEKKRKKIMKTQLTDTEKVTLKKTLSHSDKEDEADISNIIFRGQQESLWNVFTSNIKSLDLLHFFKKTIYTAEELIKLKKEKYYEIHKSNTLRDLNEITISLEAKYNSILSLIFFLFFIVIFIAMLNTMTLPSQQQFIKDYISTIIGEADSTSTLTETKEKVKSFIKTIYSDTNDRINKELIKNYIIFNPFYFRITFNNYLMKDNDNNITQEVFQYKKAKDDLQSSTKFETKITYTKENNREAYNKKGGYVYWFDDSSPLSDINLSNDLYIKDLDTDYYYDIDKLNINKDFNLNFDKIFTYNLKSFVIDFFLISKHDYFIAYVQSIYSRNETGQFNSHIKIDSIPINRYITYHDFYRFFFEAIYYIIVIIITIQELGVYLGLLKKYIDDDYNSQDSFTKTKFESSTCINKFFRFDMNKYAFVKSCVILFIIFDIIKTFFLRIFYFIFLLIKSFFQYILIDFFNLFDFASLTISYSLIPISVSIIKNTNKINFLPLETNKASMDIAIVNELSSLYNTYMSWQSINAILIFLRLIQNFKFSKTVNAIMNSLTRNISMIIASIVVIIIIDLGFGLCGFAMLSQYSSGFSQSGLSMLTLMTMISGKRTISDVVVNSNWKVILFVIVFFIVNAFIVINVMFGVVLFGFFEVKKREMLYENNDDDNILWVVYDTIKNTFIEKSILAEEIANKIYRENEYENHLKQKIKSVNEDRKNTKHCDTVTLMSDFYRRYLKDINEKEKEYLGSGEIEVRMMVYMMLIMRLKEEDDEEIEMKEMNKEKESKEIMLKEIIKCIDEENNKEGVSNNDANNILVKVDENNEEFNNKDIMPSRINSLFINVTSKRILKEFLMCYSTINHKHFKQNLYEKYFCYLFNNNSLISNPFCFIDSYSSPLTERRMKRYLHSNRIFAISKECQSPSQFIPSRTFINSLLTQSMIYLPCSSNECHDESKCDKCTSILSSLSSIKDKVYKLYLQYFLSPPSSNDINREDRNIFLSYHLCHYLTSDNDKYSIHFINDFFTFICHSFLKEYNDITIDKEINDDNNRELIRLYVKREKFRCLHHLIYNTYSREEKRKLSLDYNNYAISTNVNSDKSKYYNLFIYLHGLNENNSETALDKLYSMFNIQKSIYSLEQCMLFVLKNESMKNSINFGDIFRKEFLLYANDDIFYEIYLEDHSMPYRNEKKSKEMNDIINQYHSRKVFPSLLISIWKECSDKFEMFFGYNQFISSINKIEEEINIVKIIVNNEKEIDVYSMFNLEEKSDVLSMMEFTEIEVEKLKRITRNISEKRRFIISQEDFKRCHSIFDIIKLLHMKNVNYGYQFEILFLFFTSQLEQMKQMLSKINQRFESVPQEILGYQSSLSFYEKISIMKFISLLKSRIKYLSLNEYYKELSNSTVYQKEDIQFDNNKEIDDPLYEVPNEFINEEGNTDRKNNHVSFMNSPFIFICSLDVKDAIDIVSKVKNEYIQQFYIGVIEYLYGIDDDIKYYLKRNIKNGFAVKYDELMNFYAIKGNLERKEQNYKIQQKELEDNIHYLEERNNNYKSIFENFTNEKKKLEKEIYH